MSNWIFPLTILPGIGLLIMSSTNWSTALTSEINGLFAAAKCDQFILERKIRQLGLVNRALVLLYLAASFCALGGFVGAICMNEMNISSTLPVTIIIGIGILCLFLATAMLIVFAGRAVRIKQDQFRNQLK